MTAPTTPPRKTDHDKKEPDEDLRYREEAPQVIGDFGQDDAFSTESHPEGLRYGEKKRPPGSEFHGTPGVSADDTEDTPPLSVGQDGA